MTRQGNPKCYESPSARMSRRSAILAFLTGTIGTIRGWTATQLGLFSDDSDIGETAVRGLTRFDELEGQYTVNGAGENLWAMKDAFHFVWKQVAGDVTIAADVSFMDRTPDAKAFVMIRQTLKPDSGYVALVLHANGLYALQFRAFTGVKTSDYPSSVKFPPRLRLERSGDVITGYGGPPGRERSAGASTTLARGPVYVGIGVCSGFTDVLVTAGFSRLELIETPRPRQL